MLNHFEVRLAEPNERYFPHRCIFIDGQRLDLLIAQITGITLVEGMIPTMLPWSPISDEQEFVWTRILPQDTQETICPILMCPDEMSFDSDLITAHIRRHENHIHWSQFGSWLVHEAPLKTEGPCISYTPGAEGLKKLDPSIRFVFEAVQYERELMKLKSAPQFP